MGLHPLVSWLTDRRFISVWSSSGSSAELSGGMVADEVIFIMAGVLQSAGGKR